MNATILTSTWSKTFWYYGILKYNISNEISESTYGDGLYHFMLITFYSEYFILHINMTWGLKGSINTQPMTLIEAEHVLGRWEGQVWVLYQYILW